MTKRLLITAALLAATACTRGPVAPDVHRDQFLRDWAETDGYRLGHPVDATPTPDGRRVLFLRSGPRDRVRRLFQYEISTGETRELVTPEQLMGSAEEELSREEKARRERMRLTARGFASFELSRDGRRVILPLSGNLYALDLKTGEPRTLYDGAEAAIDPQLSPDGSRLAYVKGYDLYVRELASGRETRLTAGGSEHLTHGLAEFVAQEEMGRYSGFWWSPDSRWIAYQEADLSELERFAIGDPAAPESGADFFHYPRPGKANARVRLGVVAATGGGTTWIDWDVDRYPYLARVLWEEERAPLSIVVQSRDQREQALLEVNPRNGKTAILHADRDEAWVNLETPKWLADGSGFLALRESSGERELVRYGRDGLHPQVLIPGDKRFLRLIDVVKATGEVYALATPAPTEVQLLRTTVAGGGVEVLHAGPAERDAAVGRNGASYVLVESSLEGPPRTTVHARDGSLLGVLPSVAEAPPFSPSVELRMIPTGRLDFQTALVRPRDFDAGRQYPVIVHVYGGPGVTRVQAHRDKYLQPQWFADQGAIVLMAENRGSPRRDRAWERSISGNFGAVPLEDQVAVLEAMAARVPQMDLSRVGIYGWSFGGYMSALAVMKRPDVFKVGVAGAPVTEWRDYDTHYTERYLRTPQDNPQGYHESSLLPLAPRLSRPLMLIHGTSDDNVYFFHSLKLANALFRAGKPFEFLPLNSLTHMVPDPLVQQRLYTRMADFLFAHLGVPR